MPDRTVEDTTQIDSGGRALQLLYFGPASTPGDLAVLDTSTGVLFAGGLVSAGAHSGAAQRADLRLARRARPGAGARAARDRAGLPARS